ncbi:MAG: AraC family transcriptional regulator [Muribaculaceae bacterium]|nr:AraC family transcriptional regulator [Muribaculaceae bacterium]
MKPPVVDIFDVDATSITARLSTVHPSQNAFMLCTAGSVTLEMDHSKYVLHPGDLFIYPTLAHITVSSCTPNLQGVGGMADFELVLKALEAVSHTQRLTQIRANPCFSLTAEQFARVLRMVELVRSRRTEASVFADRIVLALTQTLMFEIMDAYVSHTPAEAQQPSRADTVFMRFLSELSTHFREQREVSFYASRLNLTPRYFATIIREKSGMSPGGWIARFVIAEAKTLLSNPDTSIKEVACALHFPNQSFFGRYFRQNTGMSPGEYRRCGN